ncbi:MAG: S-adenosylmethionine decarboxylase [Thermoleophilia bacterium]
MSLLTSASSQLADSASAPAMTDLAPMIVRQRLVIEGIPPAPVGDAAIRTYLEQLADVCEMTMLLAPVTHRSERYGWAGWAHWETSGAHFYAWETPLLFLSVDIYACKAFNAQRAVQFTNDFFACSAIVAKEF